MFLNPHKAVILSEAPRRSIPPQRVLWRAVEGPRRCLLAAALLGFPATNYERNEKVTVSERSASQIYRVTQRLAARSRRACPEHSRRNPEGACHTDAARSFSTTGFAPVGMTIRFLRGSWLTLHQPLDAEARGTTIRLPIPQ